MVGVAVIEVLLSWSLSMQQESSPSNPEGPQVSDVDKKDFVKTLPVYRK